MPRSDQSEKRKEKKMESISVLLVQKFSRCRIFACVARCLPFVRLSDDLVARLVGTKLRNETAKQRFRDGVFQRAMFRVLDTCSGTEGGGSKIGHLQIWRERDVHVVIQFTPYSINHEWMNVVRGKAFREFTNVPHAHFAQPMSRNSRACSFHSST